MTSDVSEVREAMSEDFVKVPMAAYLWLMGFGDECFEPDRPGNFWWRGAFNDKAGIDAAAIFKKQAHGITATAKGE